MTSLLSRVVAVLLAFSTYIADFDPNAPPPTTYIVNTNTDRFHDPDCGHVDSIKEHNRWEYTGTREALIEFGYVPCKVCKP